MVFDNMEHYSYNLNMDRLISVMEAMKILSISRTSLYALVKEGKIASVKLGGRTLFKESELNRFIESLGSDKE